jgi:hypothetical protein
MLISRQLASGIKMRVFPSGCGRHEAGGQAKESRAEKQNHTARNENQATQDEHPTDV